VTLALFRGVLGTDRPVMHELRSGISFDDHGIW